MALRETIAGKVSFVQARLDRLRSHASVPKEEFLNDPDLQDVVLHNLQLAIQGCIDLGSHVVSEEAWGTPGSFSEVFQILHEHGIIAEDLSHRLVQMVGFRNRIVRGYENIDLDIVYDMWHQRLGDIEKYLLSVAEHFVL